ncbi:serine/arginine-rich splicing factor 4-like [Aphidius gifuensis]|uniref:serine/arginine-rich splicing factor 4-like n=1 Tax=Aphidius gifuensis TaxID=684658 RepID=UPI001CDC574F|nr:serine/arginine-rich splicing factor 4-like [Aphidius gifuensis]
MENKVKKRTYRTWLHPSFKEESVSRRTVRRWKKAVAEAVERISAIDHTFSGLNHSAKCSKPGNSSKEKSKTENNKHNSRKRGSSKHSDDEYDISHKRRNVQVRNPSHSNSSPPGTEATESEGCADRSLVQEKSHSRPSQNVHRRNSCADYNKSNEKRKWHGSSDRNRSSSRNKDRSSMHVPVNTNSDRRKRNENESRTRREDKEVQTLLKKILDSQDQVGKKLEKLENTVKAAGKDVKEIFDKNLKVLLQILELLLKFDSIAEENKTKPEPFNDGSGLPSVGFERRIADSDKKEIHIGQDIWIDSGSWCMVRNRAGASESKFIKSLMSIIYTPNEIINSSALGQTSNREKVSEKRPALDPIRMLALQDSLTWYKQMQNEEITLAQCRIEAEKVLKKYVGSKITDSRKSARPKKPANGRKKRNDMMRDKKNDCLKKKTTLATKNDVCHRDRGSHRLSFSRSRSRSRSESRSRSHSRSHHLSFSRSRSHSRSHSRSCSHSRSHRLSFSRSRSHSRSHSRSESHSRSHRLSFSRSHSHSRDFSRSESRSRNDSRRRSCSRGRCHSKK